MNIAIFNFATFNLATTLGAFSFGSLFFIAPATSAEVSVERHAERAVVQIDGELFAEYRTLGHQPVIWPIIGPTGEPMTRSYPLGPLLESEMGDHPHHRSLWFTHGDVNGMDFWVDPKAKQADSPKNEILHRKFVKIESKDRQAVIVTQNDWTSDGRKICEDERTVVFGTDGGMRWIDFTIQLKATAGDVKFGDTKEGTFAIRVPGPMKVDAQLGGHLVNSRGQKDAAAWGQPAEWVDYYGPVAGETVGIAILSHPSNFRHPCRWHVRNYGLFTANPFGEHHFKKSNVEQGAVTVSAGDSLTLRYRVLFHQGDTQGANIEKVYRDFAALVPE